MKVFDKTSDEFKLLYEDVSESFSGGRLNDDSLENSIMNMALLDEQTNKACTPNRNESFQQSS